MTPITPASTCPLVIEKDHCPPVPEHRSLPPHDGPIPSPYEKPYSSLGELKPAHLISFAHQITNGMVCVCVCVCTHACMCLCMGVYAIISISWNQTLVYYYCVWYTCIMYNLQGWGFQLLYNGIDHNVQVFSQHSPILTSEDSFLHTWLPCILATVCLLTEIPLLRRTPLRQMTA